MSQFALYDCILDSLEETARKQELDRAIKSNMLPALAQALEPVIAQYMAQKECFPDRKTFWAIVNNFNQDGSRIEVLLKTRYTNEGKHWLLLREQLLGTARRRWDMISSADQKEIASRAWHCIHRHLPRFLFVARFSTWATRILLNEYLRLKSKIEKDSQKCLLDKVNEQAPYWASRLSNCFGSA